VETLGAAGGRWRGKLAATEERRSKLRHYKEVDAD